VTIAANVLPSAASGFNCTPVTIDNGSDRSVYRMHVRGIRVSVGDPGSPISICDGHHRIQIGRYLAPGARDELASQLRRKLAACR
jgi:uncharacterized membrane protein